MIGGGSSVENSQVSLEKNVLYLQRFLSDRGMSDVPHEILFGAGLSRVNDVKYVDPKLKPSRANELVAEIFKREDHSDTRYRPHEIPHLWGPSSRKSISRWFDEVGAKLNERDRLFIYYTGHGGRGAKRDTTLALWHEPDMPVSEFAKLLDRLPPKVSVVLIMVQCFGGGFADVIFNDRNPAKGLSSQNRCGFFATTADRVAAGCTPDVNEEDYREYSTYFWAALYGRKRSGEAVPPPDYDGDGRVSLAEAHAYALVQSDTVDISMKTSDVFLRRFSTMHTATDPKTLIDADSGYQALLDHADPPERAALQGLSERLQLDGFNHTQAARSMAEGIRQRRAALESEQTRLRASHDRSCEALQAEVEARWPELSRPTGAAAKKLIAAEGPRIVKAIESSAAYPQLHREDERLDAIDAESTDLERKWVKTQRFIRVAEHVALAANLPHVASAEVRARYAALLAAEAGVLPPHAHD